MTPESNFIEDYLTYDAIIDWHHIDIQRQTNEIIGDVCHEAGKARLLYEWVRDTVAHSGDIDSQVLTSSASEVLLHGTGICFSKSHLLAALLRSVQIPAGFCYQVLRNDPPHDNTLVLHGINGIYLSEFKEWIVVDARGNTGGLDAQFRTDKPQLAFSMDTSAGEFLYETVFASPSPYVVDRLGRCNSRDEFGTVLPSKCNIGGEYDNPAACQGTSLMRP